MTLYLEAIYPSVTNLGPGRRIGLWVQGCSLGCPGCMASDLFGRRPASAIDTDDVCEMLRPLFSSADGVTVSGGEPFEQAEALAEVLQTVREETDLDILVYSGYRLDEIRKMGAPERKLLSLVDVLIDGRFERGSPGVKLWRGSDNQRMCILTDRGRRFAEYRDAVYGPSRELMVGRTSDGQVRIIGIPGRAEGDG